jgi:stage II sporulation protein D
MSISRIMRKWMIYLITVVFLVVCALQISPMRGLLRAQDLSDPLTIRVALELDLPSADFSISEGSYELVDYVTQQVLTTASTNGKWVVAPAGMNNLQISALGKADNRLGSSMVILRQKNSAGTNVFSFKNKRYRGDLLIINAQGKLQVINLIDVEQYLYGVVGAEMGQGAPEEAYKAQAVVSRTYALFYKQHPQLYYDVGITTRWQVCGGYDAELSSSPQAKKAVDATRGQVIYYDGQIIQAFFHSNSGGYTEASENVWSASIPYIQPVATPEDILAGQPFQQEGWAGETFQWEKTLTRQQLNSLFANCNVGNILDLTAKRWAIDPQTGEYLTKQTVSGRVTQLDVIGERGTKSFFKDNIRTVLGLRSTLFEIISDSSVKVWNAFGLADECNSTTNFYAVTADGYKTKLNGNNVSYYVLSEDGVKTVPKNFTSITIKGRGNGHGLGMSQWGARGMALNGVKYRNILEHFYNQDRFDGKLTIGPYRP